MELPKVGNHCSLSDCNILDFLPFSCPSCRLIYCQNHRLPDAHACSRKYDSNEKPDIDPSKVKIPCELQGCNVTELLATFCGNCQKHYCVKHRHGQDHNCDTSAQAIGQAERQKRIQEVIQKHKESSGLPSTRMAAPKESPKSVSKPKKTMPIVELMKLKKNAKGDSSIPSESRVYFKVHVKSSKEPVGLFFNKSWTIGKTIDKAASLAGVSNLNNSGAGTKLVLKPNKDSEILETSLTLEELIKRNVIQNAGEIFLDVVECK
ncbi:hypothetical protein BKA69DRAFT_1051814 [Paraphysoderma sedebokerense]|nr:hypothetical protein BKA69DRAFT_1051814 [Paraphysoderma sedebokerense]